MEFKEYIRSMSKPPLLIICLVALFHVLALIYSIFGKLSIPITEVEWVDVLAHVLYTSSAILLYTMRKKAAIFYILLTIVSLLLKYYYSEFSVEGIFANACFPLNFMMSTCLLIFYKRFR